MESNDKNDKAMNETNGVNGVNGINEIKALFECATVAEMEQRLRLAKAEFKARRASIMLADAEQRAAIAAEQSAAALEQARLMAEMEADVADRVRRGSMTGDAKLKARTEERVAALAALQQKLDDLKAMGERITELTRLEMKGAKGALVTTSTLLRQAIAEAVAKNPRCYGPRRLDKAKACLYGYCRREGLDEMRWTVKDGEAYGRVQFRSEAFDGQQQEGGAL